MMCMELPVCVWGGGGGYALIGNLLLLGPQKAEN